MGIATETLQLVMEYAFKTLLLKQLWCLIDNTNDVSKALFEKCGFVQTGTLKQWKQTEAGYADVLVYQCVK